MKPLPSSTSRNAASSRGISGSYSARTSTRGIVCTRGHFSCRDLPVDQKSQQEQEACDDDVFEVVEALIEPAIAAAEAVAAARKGERPHGGADQRQQRVRRKPHL